MSGLSQSFDTESSYRGAVGATLALAQREIRVFDRDLLALGFEESKRIDLMTVFLIANRSRRIHFVVHDDDPIQRLAPRLLAFLSRFGHAIEVRRTPEHLRHLSDCWVLADGAHGTIRFHRDHPRGKQIWNDKGQIGPWWQRAEDLWLESEPCSPASVTGL
jgi:hypothetical protein